eukprot:1904208-Prymnesium_polylepis.3
MNGKQRMRTSTDGNEAATLSRALSVEPWPNGTCGTSYKAAAACKRNTTHAAAAASATHAAASAKGTEA